MWDRVLVRASILVVAVAALTFSAAATAGRNLADGWAATAPEIIKLPDYCQKQFLSNHKSYEGGACDGVHHFCVGLVLLDRASNPSIPKRDRQRVLKHAHTEIGYMAKRMQPSCRRAPDLQVAQMRLQMLDIMLK